MRNCQYVLSAGYLDNTIKVTSIRTGETFCSVSAQDYGHNDFITALRLATDQQTLITGGNDGSVVIWHALW